MGIARGRVANAQENRHFALVPVLLQRGHVRVEGQVIRNRNQFFLGNTQIGPVVPIQAVGKRDDSVEAIITTGQGQNC